MNLRKLASTCTLGLLVLAACGDDDQTVDPGGQQNPALEVGVFHEGQSANVDLGTLSTTAYKGVSLVKLSDVWTASGFTADRTTLEFEFVASDGFKPSNKDCADLPGTVLDQGYIDPATRNLTWDEALGFQGCYSVKDTVQINAHEPTAGDAGVE